MLLATAPNRGDPTQVGPTLVPTGQRLAPGGTRLLFFGRPLDLAVSPVDGSVAIKNSHGIVFVDRDGNRIIQDLRLPRDRMQYPLNLGGNGLAGIVWNRDGTTVWTPDGFSLLRSATRKNDGRYSWDPNVELPGPSGSFRDPTTHELDASVPTGVTLSNDGRTLFVALSRNDTVAAVDASSRTIRYTIPVGAAPFGLLTVGQKLYVSNMGGAEPMNGTPSADSGGERIRVDPRTGVALGGSVSVIDLASRREIKQIAVGSDPTAMALSRDGQQMFVTNANGDSIGVIDIASDKLSRTVSMPMQAGYGASPNAVAVSPINGNVYVAEGGDNRVLILNGQTLSPISQIATGWYPDGVAFAPNGDLYITSLKGIGSRGREFGLVHGDLGFRLFVPPNKAGDNVYDYSGLLQRQASIATVGVNQSSAAFDVATKSAPPQRVRPSTFKHVIYIIKENHTYDDYFGDVARGNGDPALCAFPRNLTPNHHALADRFGLFTNFYVNGTMSADGHQWTDEAMASDYVERNTASWARTYPSDGTDPLAYSSKGFIWERVLDAHLSFRDYGEFVTSEPTFTPPNATWLQFYNDRARGMHTVAFKNNVNIKALAPYVDQAYPGFTLRISDQARADEFLHEFRTFERTGRLPSLVLMLLGNDHTAGTAPGYPVPDSAVADNDLALGRIVEAVSHSRYWRDTAIFVVEDDAQNGLDHVDGHRTMALVISAHNPSHLVSSRFYNQTSILKTIELVLGLRSLTQFDAHANAIVEPFLRAEPDLRPYVALPNGVPLDRLNPKPQALSGVARSYAAGLQHANFDAPDVADQRLLSASLRDYVHRRNARGRD
jgi:YVTN family beta-propeller protein